MAAVLLGLGLVVLALPAAAPAAGAAPDPPASTPLPGAPSASPSASPSGDTDDGGGGGTRKCLKNLPKCAKEGIDRGTDKLRDLPGDMATAGANAMLTPLAEGISQTTNEMIRIIVTGWLSIPSVRISDSGVVEVKPDPHGGGTKLANGGCLQPIPNATLQPPTLQPGQPAVTGLSGPPGSGSPTTAGPDETSCGTTKAISQFSSAKVQAVMVAVGTIVAVLLLIFQAMRTAFTRRGTHLMDALQGLLIMAVMVSLGLVLLNGLLIFSDALTNSILDSSLGKGLGERVSKMLGLSVAAFGPVPVILFGVIVFVIATTQLIMLFIRQAAIPVLAMLMPVAAAGQVGGQISRQWLVRLWSSLFAIVLYKPLAALIFAVGFLETGEGKGFWDIVRGLTTLALAIFALPTLMKIFTPIVGQAVSIGAHNVTLAGFIGGGVAGGSMLGSLLGGRGGADDGGEGSGGGRPASPQSYERGAAAAVPAAGAALAVGQVVTDIAEGIDKKIAQGADAFIGGDGAAESGQRTGGTAGAEADADAPSQRLQGSPGLDPRDFPHSDLAPSTSRSAPHTAAGNEQPEDQR